jgi:hypothetical protein
MTVSRLGQVVSRLPMFFLALLCDLGKFPSSSLIPALLVLVAKGK